MPVLTLNRMSRSLILLFCISSCASNKIAVYSDTRFDPIPKVETSSYKSPQERNEQDSTNAIGISISSGGSRAQYFGTGVLIGLDEIKKNNRSFLDEIDYFSTVSGGGFAVGYYLTLIKNDILINRSFFDFWKSDDRKIILEESLKRDVTAASVLKLSRYERNKMRKSYPDMIETELLQTGKSYYGNKINRLYLSDFFIPSTSSEKITMPMFVANGTIYNNGERLPFMPHIVEDLEISASMLPNESFTINKGYGLPLSYAITGSAAFPGVLPMLKFSIKGQADSVVRVIDGATVDVLGYTTLFELMHCDKLDNKNKKLLLVDCGGLGKELQKQDKRRVRIIPLLKKSLLFAVEINSFYAEENIKLLTHYYDLDEKNIKTIGFFTLKNRFIELEQILDAGALMKQIDLKKRINTGKMKWKDLYKEFAANEVFAGYTENNLSEIPSERFKEFTVKEIFELFELSSQVETKLKIAPWEKESLLLAGRFAVYLKQEELKNMLN